MIGQLHHYCSSAVFLSIVRNKEIWLTDLSLSNDRAEGVWMLEHWLDKFSSRDSEQRLQRKGAKTAVEMCCVETWRLGSAFRKSPIF